MKPYQSTKHGKPVKKSRWAWTGFHWYGRDDQGVSIWSGNPKTLGWTAWLMGGIGVIELVASGVLLSAGQSEPSYVFAPMGALFLGIACYMRRHYAWLKNLGTVEQVAADLEVDAEGLDRLAKGREIKPRVILDGVPYYNLSDLGEAALLLRAASPNAEETLLRTAESSKTDDTTLLQPASNAPQIIYEPALAEHETPEQLNYASTGMSEPRE